METSESPKERCIAALNQMGPISQELEVRMRLPEELFQHGTELSFSNDPAKDLRAFVPWLESGAELPKDSPDYGILIYPRGSSTMCFLLDKSRKITVIEAVRNANAGEGDWSHFHHALRTALRKAAALESGGKKFQFVLEGERNKVVE